MRLNSHLPPSLHCSCKSRPLLRCQLGLAPEPHATCLGPLASFPRACSDQIALNIGKAAQNSNHEPARRRRTRRRLSARAGKGPPSPRHRSFSELTQGFKTLPTVSATIKGFEVMRMIRMRQMRHA
jgi:hypothetical protein